MKNLKFLLLFIFLISVFISCEESDEADESNTINIGLMVPILQYEEFSNEMKNAANLAIEEINSNGDILGKKLKLIVKDNEASKEVALEKGKELINDDNAVALISTASSRCLYLANNLIIDKEVLLISPSATSPQLTDLNDRGFFWRTIPSDAFQGKIIADYVKNVLEISEMAILHTNSIYGKGLKNAFTDHIMSLGTPIIFSVQSFDESEDENYDDYDFHSQLDLLLENKPPLLFLVTGAGAGLQKIIATLDTMKIFDDTYKPQIIGTEAFKSNDFLNENSHSVIKNLIGISPLNPYNQTFNNNFENFIGKAPIRSYSYSMYDAIYLIAYSILSSESTIPKDFIKKIREISSDGEKIGINEFQKAKEKIENGISIDYDGASGRLEFDENGDLASGIYEIWQIKENTSYPDSLEFETIKEVDFP
ncbi:MAG: hypothetical protein B6I24_08610 [Bacteroidetes bacterium 4572_128]|nr:MAG: hypothetical protein B6I24_08610 [Bacteroidetes bacterium 4572_128]